MCVRRLFVACAIAICLGRQASAQDQSPANTAAQSTVDAPHWQPFGLVPVDQSGAGRRGYVLPGESADVIAPGVNQWSVHLVASNNFYREETEHIVINQRAESHTLALGYRRGIRFGVFPRVEIGGQLQFHESDSGFLNGFISGFEDAFVSLTGHTSSKNHLRSSPDAPPLGTVITKDGQTLFSSPGREKGFGDISLVAKAMLREGTDGGPRVAARVSFNLSGASSFTAGNFAGIGLSVDKTFGRRLAFFGDLRTAVLFDRDSTWGVPLRRMTAGFSLGPELRVMTSTSLSLQVSANTTPYETTGVLALDKAYGDLTAGLSHRFSVRGRALVTQFYARENMNMPFDVRWNTDPDLSIGIKLTLQ